MRMNKNPIAELQSILEGVDKITLKIREKSAGAKDMDKLRNLFTKPLFDNPALSLQTPEDLCAAVRDAENGDHLLQVRKAAEGPPSYFLGRVYSPIGLPYPLILEGIHRSPHFPTLDDSFEKLFDRGREKWFMRLDDLRRPTRNFLQIIDGAGSHDVDDFLIRLGSSILGAARHEDQIPAKKAAALLGLPEFTQAMELLYFCLSADLAAIRNNLETKTVDFFENALPHAPLHGLLARLPSMSGKAVDALPHQALAQYHRLAAAFRDLLDAHTEWGRPPSPTPVYKILYANLWRIDLIKKQIKESDEIARAREKLITSSNTAVDEILKSVLRKLNTI